MTERRFRRRLSAPVALLAALAIAAGGSSTPWAVSPSASAPSARSVGFPLDHVELVALRAQASEIEPELRR